MRHNLVTSWGREGAETRATESPGSRLRLRLSCGGRVSEKSSLTLVSHPKRSPFPYTAPVRPGPNTPRRELPY